MLGVWADARANQWARWTAAWSMRWAYRDLVAGVSVRRPAAMVEGSRFARYSRRISITELYAHDDASEQQMNF